LHQVIAEFVDHLIQGCGVDAQPAVDFVFFKRREFAVVKRTIGEQGKGYTRDMASALSVV
jgi:hypothetical protein